MDLASLIARFGLPVVFAGSVLEGETVLLLAGYAAHRGFLDFFAVVAAAALGAVAGDQFWFSLGRRHGVRVALARPWLRAPLRRALGLVERHPVGMVFAMRFAWGLRTALPVAAGMSRVDWRRFLVLNVLSAAVWAPLVAGAGYVFGALITHYLADVHRIEHWLMLGVALAALTFHVWRRRRSTPAKPPSVRANHD